MRWRLGISLLTVLTSAIAVGAAVLGPLYLQAAGDSVVRSTIAAASVESRGETVSAPPGAVASLGQVQAAERTVVRAGAQDRFYGFPITSILTGVGMTSARGGPVRSQLLSRSGICRVLHFEAGGCDMGADDAAISDRSAREMGLSLGAVVDASVTGRSQPLQLRITGIYAVPNFDLAYWWGDASGYFPFGQVTSGSQRIPEIDSLVTSPATALSVPVQAAPQITGQVPLRAGSVGLAQEGSLRRVLSAVDASITARGITVNTQLNALLAGADGQRHEMSTIVAVAAVQLVVLAIWVLAGLLIRSSDARQAEIRVARLRGFPPISLLAVSALEPAALCALGLALGVGAAWGAVVLARDQVLNPAAVIAPDGWLFAALGVTVAAIAGALAFGTLRLLRSADVRVSTAAGTASRRAGVVVDIVLLVLAVVALVALETNGNLSGHSNPIAAAAPGLIALGTAVIAVQCVLFACRAGVAASAYSDRIAIFLALRQIVRRPAAMRQTRVLIIALCLACFAISAWSVAHTNRAAAATFNVGTKEVVTVTPRGVDLERAVDRVDPHGRFAMAAVEITTPSSTVLAVDASRLTAALPWPRGISRTTLPATGRLLAPPTDPAINLTDTPVRLSANAAVSGSGTAASNLDVGLWAFNPQAGTTIVDLGRLHPGAWTYQAALGGACAGGCRLAGLGLIPAPRHNAPTTGTIRFTITHLFLRTPSAGWAAVSFDPLARDWRATAAGVRVQPGPEPGLTLVVPASATAVYTGAVGFATVPMFSPADHPITLPAAVTSEIEALNGIAGVRIAGLDGNTLTVASAVTATALPRVGANAAMLDLDLLGRSQVDSTVPETADQVWLGPAAPGDAVARLQAAGLRVDRIETASAVLRQLDQSAPALADDFLLVATIVALFAAAASTLGALGADTRQRATELTALELTGVPRRVLARSLALESVVLAATALFGVGAGILAAIMAIPALPELGSTAVIPLQYGLPGGLVGAVSAAVVAVILLATAAVSGVLVHRMSPILLRMAPDDSAG